MAPNAEIRFDSADPLPGPITIRLLSLPVLEASDTVTLPAEVSAGCVTTNETLLVLPLSVS